MKASAISRFNFIVFIWGFTAILGKLISLQALELVWYRLVITIVSLLFFFRYQKFSLRLPAKAMLSMIGIGFIVGTHWYCFYHAIKVSNVSITLICLSTISLFTALLEPLLFRRKISVYEVGLALMMVLGIGMIFKFELNYLQGILYGIGAALGGSLFVILNARLIHQHHAYAISFYEMVGAFLLLSGCMLFQKTSLPSLQLSMSDFFYLLLLGILCTAYPFIVSVKLMKELSPFTANMLTNLEPVYGIILSLLIFGESEHMSSGFYGGTVLILLTLFVYIYMKRKEKPSA